MKKLVFCLGFLFPVITSAALSAVGVSSKPLVGFVSGAGSVSSADTILGAIQKLDGNVAGKQPSACTTNDFLIGVGGVATPQTGTQATALLDVMTATTKGLAPSGASLGATYYLNATGAFTVPAGGGGGGGSGTPHVITSGTSWTAPAGVTVADIMIIGGGGGGAGGGGGGSGSVTGSVNAAGGGGGGSGQKGSNGSYLFFKHVNLVPGTSYPITIGAAGTAGTGGAGGNNVASGGGIDGSNGTAGGAGGSTTFTIGNMTYTAAGGAAGTTVGAYGHAGSSAGGNGGSGVHSGGTGGGYSSIGQNGASATDGSGGLWFGNELAGTRGTASIYYDASSGTGTGGAGAACDGRSFPGLDVDLGGGYFAANAGRGGNSGSGGGNSNGPPGSAQAGGDALTPTPYGAGGGCGGGGGGTGGTTTTWPFAGGSHAGNGGAGGPGGSGALVFFY